MGQVYRSVPSIIEAVRFDGGNIGEILDLIRDSGAALTANNDGTLTLHENGMHDRIVTPRHGDCWVSRRAGSGIITSHGERAFSLGWEPAT